jgi:tetratricopeptide (TPR) repeat protein
VRHLGQKIQNRLPDDATELMMLLARTRAQQATQGGAAREQTRLLEEAVSLLDRAQQFSGDRVPRALFEDRNNYRIELGDSAGAKIDLARAEATPVATARDHYLRGTALATEKKYDSAIRELRAALRLDPKHFWARFQLGISYYQNGQFQSAAAAYDACEAMWIECAWVNFNRGLAYSRLDRLGDAIDDYTTAIQKDRWFAAAYLNRGLARLQRREYRDAISDLSRAIELDSRSAPAACSARATALAGHGQWSEAKAAYDAALRANPDDASILMSRGFALARHDPEQALADFDRVLATNPESATAHYGRAYVLSEAADGRREAIDAAREALRIDENHVGAQCTLAVLLAREGTYREAIEQIEQALRRSASAAVKYSAACVYALAIPAEAGHADRSMEHLQASLAQGYGHEVYATDPDLAPLRALPVFRDLSDR